MKDNYFVSDKSVVNTDLIGEGTKIWHFSNIQSGARIGRYCVLGQNVNIGNNVVIGDYCKIQNNVSIYEGVTLEDYVFVAPSVVFTNVLMPRSQYPVDSKDYLKTKVKRGATIGANATIVCGVTLGEYCMIGAGAVVTKDVPSYTLVIGNPAREIGYVSQAGGRLEFPRIWSEKLYAKCPKTNEEYEKTFKGIRKVTRES